MNSKTMMELHKQTIATYWLLRNEGFTNEEAEVQVIRLKRWICKLKGLDYSQFR